MNEHSLTNDNYFQDERYMSVSSWKKFNKCELQGTLPFTEDYNASMLVGSYVDEYVSGTLDQFKEAHPELFVTKFVQNETTIQEIQKQDPSYITRNGTFVASKKTEAMEKFPMYFTEEVRLKAEFKQADEICKYIDSKPRLQKFLGGEKQTIMVGEIEGVPFKIKMDSYIPDKLIADLKIMRSVTNSQGDYVDFITPWGYDVQMACYQEVVRQNTGKQLPCYIVAVTKEEPINSVVIQIPQDVLDRALYQVQSTVRDYYDIKQGRKTANGCGKCKACIEAREDVPLISMAQFMME